MNEPRPFDVYRHFKGNLYQVLTIAENSEDGSSQVVYQQLYAPYKAYVRPYEMFISRVDKEKYPDSTQEFRFERVDMTQIESKLEQKTLEQKIPEQKMPEQEISEQKVESQEEEFELDPILMKFLDANTYEEKLEILTQMHASITQEMINTIAASLDTEVKSGDLETRYDELKSCLITMERYECNRLR